MGKIRVTIWNEYVHERQDGAVGDLIRSFYPRGIHNALKENLAADDLEIKAVSLDMPSQGLPDDLLANTDVLVWWGHCAHAQVEDALVEKIRQRILEGMGLVVLHSGHKSKIFVRMAATSCSLRWREIGERERVWVVDSQHPVAQGVPETFVVPNTEMYGEPFGIPDDAHVVFASWYEGGNVFRSGVAFRRGAGNIFYFSPGHETFPIYHQPEVVKVIGNAVRWAAPALPPQKTTCWNRETPVEKVETKNPLDALDTSALHAAAPADGSAKAAGKAAPPSAPNILPRRLVAGSGETPPSETVNVAAIGAGARAAADIEGLDQAGARIVALCDVDDERCEWERKKRPELPYFKDWREMLDRLDRDIDAVMVGVPDHWHATMAIECLRRGKHVQCEKPLAQSFHEVDAMLDEARKHPELVTQAMNQGHAYDTIRDFREWVEAGLIGEVSEAHVWCPSVYSFMDQLDDLKKTWEVPKTLDWERWQGPVPHRPYCPHFVPRFWRRWTPWGTSTLGDWSCHLMDPLFWTFGLGMPKSVRADITGGWTPEAHGITFPKGVRTTFEFETRDGRPFRLVWFDGEACSQVPVPEQWRGPRNMFPAYNTIELQATRQGMSNGAFVYGSRGVIEYGHHGANFLRMLPDMTLEKLRAEGGCPKEKYPRIPGDNPDSKPFNEFITAVRGGQKVGSDFEYAGAMTQCALLGIAALFDSGRTLAFDAATHRFANSAAANARLRLERIAGW